MVNRCPYCGANVEPMPARAKKCPSCRELVYPRTNPITGELSLFKQNDAGFIDAFKHWEIPATKVKSLSILLIRMGTPSPSFKDIFWLFQYENRKQELLGYKGDVNKVEVLTAGDSSCPSCQALAGKKFNLEDALRSMPIPVKNCQNVCGYCRCVWIAVL